MTPETIMSVGQQAIIVAAKLTAPILLASLAIGLLVAMFQAATQINEMTLTFVPKLIVIGLVLIIAGPWMLAVMTDYFRELMLQIPVIIG